MAVFDWTGAARLTVCKLQARAHVGSSGIIGQGCMHAGAARVNVDVGSQLVNVEVLADLISGAFHWCAQSTINQ
jgi:hypothetical protein